MDTGAYCRDVESYLCRKNGGHLIRIVGPAFELVCSWAEQEIPLSVVRRGIDLTVDRAEAKGGRRRPTRIEFCEADVLAVFDDWRRAVGVEEHAPAPRRTRPSLTGHLDRVIAQLTAWRGGPDRPGGLDDTVGRLVDQLGRLRAAARTARGDGRQRLIGELADADEELLTAAQAAADVVVRDQLRRDAEHELDAFRDRMPPDAFQHAVTAATARLLRHHYRLPRTSFEA